MACSHFTVPAWPPSHPYNIFILGFQDTISWNFFHLLNISSLSPLLAPFPLHDLLFPSNYLASLMTSTAPPTPSQQLEDHMWLVLANRLSRRDRSLPAKPGIKFSSCLFSCCSYLENSSCWCVGPKNQSHLFAESLYKRQMSWKWAQTCIKLHIIEQTSVYQLLGFGRYLLPRQKPHLFWPIELPHPVLYL